MYHRLRQALLLPLLLAGLLLQAARADDAPLGKVTLQLKWAHQFQFAGYYAAQLKGYYRDAGLEVAIRDARPGPDPVRKVLSGEAQYGVGSTSLLLRRARGDPVVLLANIFQHSPLVFLTGDHSGTRSVHDLQGKRVMIEDGADELYAYLRAEGVVRSSLNELPHSFDPQDLIQGRADAISAYVTDEPFLLLQAGFPHLVLTPRAVGIDFYGDNLYTTETELEQAPQRVQAFVAASLKGWRYAMAHPEEIADHILRTYGAGRGRDYLLFEARQMRPLIQPELVEVGNINRGRWQHIVKVYQDLGQLPEDFRLTGFLPPQEREFRLPLWVLPSGMVLLALLLVLANFAVRQVALSRRLRGEIAERERMETSLRESGEQYRNLVEGAPFPIVITRRNDGLVLLMNRRAAAFFGCAPGETLAGTLPERIPDPAQRSRLQMQLQAQGVFADEEAALLDHSGYPHWVLMSALLTRYGGGEAVFTAFSDIAERRAMEDALRASEEKFRFLAENTADVVWQLDRAQRVSYINTADERLRGFPRDAVLGHPMAAMFTTEGKLAHDRAMERRRGHEGGGETGATLRFEAEQRCADGRRIWVEISSTPLYDASGAIVGYNGISRDITRRKADESALKNAHNELAEQYEKIRALQATLQEQAVRDPLTGLFNRRYLDETLELELARAKRSGAALSLVMMDIDHFKTLNDTYGHQAGDEVLRALGALLAHCSREGDILCRYGGEEFLLVLPGMDLGSACQRAEEWRIAFQDQVVHFGNFRLQATLSAGVASFPEHGAHRDELVEMADTALYRAKREGRNRTLTLPADPQPAEATPC